MNEGVSSEFCSLDYVIIDDAAKMVTQTGNGALLAKVDIRHAYRHITIHPVDRWLFGMVWEEALFVDTALPFGLRSAPKSIQCSGGCSGVDSAAGRGSQHNSLPR